MSDVSYLCTRDDVKPDFVVITRKTKQAVTEEESLFWSHLLRVPAVSTLGPAWAVTIVVMVAALTALKWLSTVDDTELIDNAIISGPCLLTRDMFPSYLHKRLADAVEDGRGVAESLASCWRYDFGAILVEEVIKCGIIDVADSGVARTIKLYPDGVTTFLLLTKWELHRRASSLPNLQLEGGEERRRLVV